MPFWARIAALVVASPLVAAPVALAGDPPRPPASNGAIGVYVEQIPTSKGPVHAGGSNNSAPGLPPRVEKKVDAQSKADADRLRAIATSSGYGAPQTTLPTTTAAEKPKAIPKPGPSTKPAESPQTAVEQATPRSAGESAAAASPTADHKEGSNLVPVLAVVAALGLIGLALAVGRGRLRRPRTR